MTTDRRETLGGTEMTTTLTREDGQGAICLAVDHGAAACVGMHAAPHGTRGEALEPIRQGRRPPLGAFGTDVAHGWTLRHAHGSH